MIEVITHNLIEGYHRWKDAPESVDFLRSRHRHIFHIRCWFEVSHEDRELEIIMTQWQIEDFLKGRYGAVCEFGEMSCEAIAREIMEYFGATEVEVLEDGFGGAHVRK